MTSKSAPRALPTAPIIALTVLITAALLALNGCAPNEPEEPEPPVVETLEVTDTPEDQGVIDIEPDTPYADQLLSRFEAIASESSMNVAISFMDLMNPADACAVNGDRSQIAASTIKLLILNELFDQVAKGMVSLDETYVLTSSDIVGGTGSLQGRGAGGTTTFREMAQLMISQSDNTATNVIIDRLGMNAINAQAQELGLTGTSLNRYMMDGSSTAAGIENYISAVDAIALLRMIYDGTFVNYEASEFAMEALLRQSDTTGILQGLYPQSGFAHKTGSLTSAQNDFGIVLGPHPYALGVFCEAGDGTGYFSQTEAYDIMVRCAQAASAVMGSY